MGLGLGFATPPRTEYLAAAHGLRMALPGGFGRCVLLVWKLLVILQLLRLLLLRGHGLLRRLLLLLLWLRL